MTPRIEVPVLITGWRRPQLIGQVLAAVRKAAPHRLFVAIDGPRPGETDACQAVHDEVSRLVTWDCQLQVLQRDRNLGCRASVSGAIEWVLSQVDQTIVLEDDTVPSLGFFQYCDELLHRYRDDERVWMISGTNLMGEWNGQGADYFFGQGGVWGWATWRRAWAHADIEMSGWQDLRQREQAAAFLGRRDWRINRPFFAASANGQIDSWAYPWAFSRAAGGGLSVIPTVNLVRNIGFGADGSHTRDPGSPLAQLPVGSLPASIRHPARMEFDRSYPRAVARVEHPSLARRVARRVRRAAAHYVQSA